MVRDTTERKRAEEALREVREGERNRMVRDLHDRALHDLTYALAEAQIIHALSEDPGLDGRLGDRIRDLRRTERRLHGAVYYTCAWARGQAAGRAPGNVADERVGACSRAARCACPAGLRGRTW